ncbi:MAG: hypothetical protein CMK09_02820 [Ponticaulis sp.]|nr:hypothetical protein [Ponticaulis sp.]
MTWLSLLLFIDDDMLSRSPWIRPEVMEKMNMKFPIILASISAAFMLAACGGGQSEEARQEAIKSFMADVYDPAADGIWTNSGWVLTMEGEESLFPTNDAEWQEVADHADNLVNLTRELQDDKYAAGDQEWKAIADGVIVFAEEAKQAALNKDEQELFDVGGDIYRACVACHQRYSVPNSTMAN